MSKLPHRPSDLPPVDKDDLVTTCNQYSEYFKLGMLASHQMTQLGGEVENALMRMDEFGSLVDTVCIANPTIFHLHSFPRCI